MTRYVTCSLCDADIPVSVGVDDAITDFVAALVAGDVATARILLTHALGDVVDTTRIHQLLADRARSIPQAMEKSS